MRLRQLTSPTCICIIAITGKNSINLSAIQAAAQVCGDEAKAKSCDQKSSDEGGHVWNSEEACLLRLTYTRFQFIC